MKYLVVCLLFLTGCNAFESEARSGLQYGDKVRVTVGLFKDCVGYLADYQEYSSAPDRVEIVQATCPAGRFYSIKLPVRNVEKIK